MLPKIHFISGIFFVVLISLFFPKITLLELAIIFLSGILIDADHMIYYSLRTKNFNLKKALKWYKSHLTETLSLPMEGRRKRYTGFYIFHGIEMLVLLLFISIFISRISLFVFLGFFFHMLLDVPHEFVIKRTVHKFSLIYSYSQFKKLGAN